MPRWERRMAASGYTSGGTASAVLRNWNLHSRPVERRVPGEAQSEIRIGAHE